MAIGSFPSQLFQRRLWLTCHCASSFRTSCYALALDRPKVVSLKICLPVAIRLEPIDHHGAVLSTVPREIPLSIAIEIEPGQLLLAGFQPVIPAFDLMNSCI